MIQKLFSFCREADNDCNLHIEVSDSHVACWCTSTNGVLQALEYFSIPAIYKNASDVLQEVKRLSILLKNEFASTELVWENQTFTCIPEKYYTPALSTQALQNAFDTGFVRQMHAANNSVVVSFAVDKLLVKAAEEIAPHATHVHKVNKLATHAYNRVPAYLRLVFYENRFLLLAVQNGNLQLATSYAGKQPKDILYNVLNTLHQLRMQPAETPVFAEGFIDANSALYKELHQYLGGLQLAEEGMINEKYPAHYFTPFYK